MHDNELNSRGITDPAGGREGGSFCVTRRGALGVGLTAAGMVAVPPLAGGPAEAQTTLPAPPTGATFPIRFTANGTDVQIEVDPRSSLLDMLRERLHLTGAKKGCDHGQCGACTVHLDGRAIASCLTLAAKVDGRDLVTIEGIGVDGLHPMQQAFIDHDALQCGYCTPGQIMAAIACVQEGNATSVERIRERMSGNICRCGAYVGIVAAIQDAALKMDEV
jgi:xanthine dehydrogenase YagT iron-sulfur-binding subunit